MSVYKDHAAIVYRVENGDDIIYSQSSPLSHFVPLFAKFTYIYPPIIVCTPEQEIGGTIEASRFLFPPDAESIANPLSTDYKSKVVAGYTIPFTDRDLIVPTMISTSLFVTRVRFTFTKKGLKRLVPIGDHYDFHDIYLRFGLNNRLLSYVRKYYNLGSLIPLFSGTMSMPREFSKEPTLMK